LVAETAADGDQHPPDNQQNRDNDEDSLHATPPPGRMSIRDHAKRRDEAVKS
jgi:hypothetical protein